jgi:Protein of unknown function (DUF2442)
MMTATAKKVWFDHGRIYVELHDERVVGLPLSWFPRLAKASAEALKQYELWENGAWIHWEKLDEDLSAEGFLTYRKEPLVSS